MDARHTIEELITHLEEMVNDAWGMPLSGGKIVLERDRLTDLITSIRTTLPGDLQQAQAIVQSRAELAAAARRDADAIIRTAELKARDLTSDSAIMQNANQSAKELLASTAAKAKELLAEAETRAAQLLNDAENQANNKLNAAETQASELLTSSEARSKEMLSSAEARSNEMLISAEARSNEMLTGAASKAKELYQTTQKFVTDTMTRADDAVAAALMELNKVKAQFNQVMPKQ